jgi:hypothetical protein
MTEPSSHEVELHLRPRQRAHRGPIAAVVGQRDAGLEEDVTAPREHRAVGEAWPVGGVADRRRLLSGRVRRPHQAEAGEGGEPAPGGAHHFTPTTWRIMPSLLVST